MDGFLFLFVSAVDGGDQCEEGGESGCPVGKAPSSAHPGTSQTERDVQQPPCESSHPDVFTRSRGNASKLASFVRVQLESSRKVSEIKTLHEKIRVSTEEAKKKEEVYKQLVIVPFPVSTFVTCGVCRSDETFVHLLIQVTQLDSLPHDASRSAYTQRILEIVSNIKKQKEEITKVTADREHIFDGCPQVKVSSLVSSFRS